MTYEYRHCGRTFERDVAVADRDSVRCPECGRKAVRLLPRRLSLSVWHQADAPVDAVVHAGHLEHRDMVEESLASDGCKEYVAGKDRRYQARPERVREIKERNKKCPQPQPRP